MKYFKKMIGDKCYLSPVSFDDIDKYTEWVNDMETGLFVLFASSVYDEHKERETLEYLTKHQIIMAIIDKDTNKAVGICGLHERNSVHRTATFGISIGDKSYWGHGIGTEATNLMLDYGFNVLNLHNISLEVIDFNKRAQKCYEKCGFTFIGTKREAIFMAGKFHNLLIYDILACEFKSPYINKLFEIVTQEETDTNKITIV
jgi:RimJ/RimL family protein N-acetyltransferase